MNFRMTALLLGLSVLAGCSEGLRAYHGPDTVIATGRDTMIDKAPLANGFAAIAYDPDGCQNWLIDDGMEGYSSPRYDPRSGLPVCNNHFPPGTVVGPYQTPYEGIRDYVPTGPRRSTVVVKR